MNKGLTLNINKRKNNLRPLTRSKLVTRSKLTEGKNKITSVDIKGALRVRFCQPEWAIMFEVAEKTGFSRRRLDVIVMNMYPSRGLEIRGIEIKVSRSDLLLELKTPDKADKIACYCDTFWLATPPGLVKANELPLSWGLMEISGIMRVRIVKNAENILEAVPITKEFMAACFRGATKIDEKEIEDRVKNAMLVKEADFETRVRRQALEMSGIERTFAALEVELTEICGENPFRNFKDENFKQVFTALYRSGITASYSGLGGIIQTLEYLINSLKAKTKMLRNEAERMNINVK